MSNWCLFTAILTWIIQTEVPQGDRMLLFRRPSRAISMLNKNLDLDITDFVTVDFTAVADVVDALGGIDIDVQEDEIVHLNNYQVEGSQVTGKEIVPVEYAGLQTLNGLQALSYCRIRYTEGSDFKRTERQRTVLQKILEKAKVPIF